MTDFLDKLWAAFPVAIVAGVGYVVRRVLTNEKQIAILQNDIKQDRKHREDEQKHRDEERKRDREEWKEIKDDVKVLIKRDNT